jgi:hypothetical protein
LLLLFLFGYDLVKFIDGHRRLCDFGLAVDDVGVDLRLCSSTLAADLQYKEAATVSRRNDSGVLEDFSNRGVLLDHFVPLNGDLHVSLVDTVVDHLLEVLSDEAVDYIANE